MRRAPPVELSAEDLTALQRTGRSSRSGMREVFRARIVLVAADGLENRDIAEQLGTLSIPSFDASNEGMLKPGAASRGR